MSTRSQKLAKLAAIKAHADLGLAVVAARVHASAERARVDAYVLPILARYAFTRDAFREIEGMPASDAIVTTTRDLYLTQDGPRLRAFYAEIDEAHRAHGFTGQEGHCPALTAENAITPAEWALIQATAPILGMDPQQVNGLIDERAEFLRLVIGICELAAQERRRVRTVAHEIANLITGQEGTQTS